MKEQARRESDLIVQEAHSEGRRVMREMAAEKQRLEEDVRKIRALLRSALETLDEGRREERQAEETPAPKPQPVEEVTDGGIRQVAG
jgi:BMFP domain-containing protein YqiC